MIIIKKANAYSYHFGPLECECQKRIRSEDDLPYCEVVFKIQRQLIPAEEPVLPFILQLFAQMCFDKSYFIPHFYFQIKDILLLSDAEEKSLLFEFDFVTLQKLHQLYFYTGNSSLWQQQWQQIKKTSNLNCNKM